jgi:hypothetical protein
MDINKEIKDAGADFKGLEPLGSTPIAPAHGIAAIALNMAMKYHDISTVKDGTLYQQYKLEGKNMEPLHLDMVFETAIKMEMFLLGASDRIAKLIVETLEVKVEEDDQNQEEAMEMGQ